MEFARPVTSLAEQPERDAQIAAVRVRAQDERFRKFQPRFGISLAIVKQVKGAGRLERAGRPGQGFGRCGLRQGMPQRASDSTKERRPVGKSAMAPERDLTINHLPKRRKLVQGDRFDLHRDILFVRAKCLCSNLQGIVVKYKLFATAYRRRALIG